MRTTIIFIVFGVFSFLVFAFMSYMDQMFLGIILAIIMMLWPVAFLLITNIAEKGIFKPKEESKRLKQDLIDGNETEPEPKKEEEEFVIPPKKDVNVTKAREELENLKKASQALEEEKMEGLLSEDAYNELKKQSDESIEKLEQEISKASGEIEEKMVYCRKGKHYISERDCIPSKIPGYVICTEHNEEIRVE